MLDLIDKVPSNSIIVQDNHPIHYAAHNLLSQIAKRKNVEIVYIPPYSPDLNPIEEMFKMLKGEVREQHCLWRENPESAVHAAFSSLVLKKITALPFFCHSFPFFHYEN
jgi:transposase